MSDLTFKQLQEEILEWRERNFPDNSLTHPLLGAFEELGELADVLFPLALATKMGIVSHHHLKGDQGIRHTPEENEAEIKDAIGDIIIYITDYCERKGYDMQTIMEDVWAEVQARDWIADPKDGRIKINDSPHLG